MKDQDLIKNPNNIDEIEVAPINKDSQVPKTIDEDSRFLQIKTELTDSFQETTGEDLLSERGQNFQFGSSSELRNTGKTENLEQRAERTFRERFPEDAKEYDEIEKSRVYENSFDDPTMKKTENEIIKLTNQIDSKNMSGVDWNKAHMMACSQIWRSFIYRYPQKAEAYRLNNKFIDSFLKNEERIKITREIEQKQDLIQQTKEKLSDTRNALGIPESKEEPVSISTLEGKISEFNEQLKAISEDSLMSVDELTEDTTKESLEKEEIDPREYFQITSFQKKAESTDPDLSHKWDSVYDYAILEDNDQLITAGYYFDNQDDSTKLLLAQKDAEGESESVLVDNLDEQEHIEILDYLKRFGSCLQTESRKKLASEIIKEINQREKDEALSLWFSNKVLDLLPNIQQTPDIKNHKLFDYITDPEKKIKLQAFLEKIGSKMNGDEFIRKLDDFTNRIPFRDNVFTKNYKFIFSEITDWITGSRQDFKPNYEILNQPESKKYTINDKIKRRIESIDQLQTSLSNLKFKEAPDIKNMKFDNRKAELVELDKIVGYVNGENSWNLSTSLGRGIENIFNIAQKFQNGQMDLNGNNDPIKLIEINGDFYIEADGRHRVAALKSLGVKKIPVLVSHAIR